MEKPLLVENNKKPIYYLSTIGILKSAIEILLKSPTFLIFTILITLSVIFTTLLQKFPPFPLNSYSLFFEKPPYYYLVHDTALVIDMAITTIQVWLIDSLDFLAAMAIVHSTSKIYLDHIHRDDHEHGAKSTSLRDLLKCSFFTKQRTKTSLLYCFSGTYALLRLFSLISSKLVASWIGHGPLVYSRTMALHVVHGITVAMVITLRSMYNALSIVGVIISILEEEKAPFEAFSESSDLLRGNWRRGTMLMLIDPALRIGLALGLPILFPSWDFLGDVAFQVVNIVLVCFGWVMSWVVCVIYYHDCKLRKRV